MKKYYAFILSTVLSAATFFAISLSHMDYPERKLGLAVFLSMVLLYAGEMLPKETIGKVAYIATLTGSIILIFTYSSINYDVGLQLTHFSGEYIYGPMVVSFIFAFYSIYGLFSREGVPGKEIDTQTLIIRVIAVLVIGMFFVLAAIIVFEMSGDYFNLTSAFTVVLAIAALTARSDDAAHLVTGNALYALLYLVFAVFFAMLHLPLLALLHLPLLGYRVFSIWEHLPDKSSSNNVDVKVIQ